MRDTGKAKRKRHYDAYDYEEAYQVQIDKLEEFE